MGGDIRAKQLRLSTRQRVLGRHRRSLARHQQDHKMDAGCRHLRLLRSCILMPPSRTRKRCLRSNIAPLLAGENVQHINTYGSPIFKAVQQKWYKALCRALTKSPKSPEYAVGEGSEPSHIDRSAGVP